VALHRSSLKVGQSVTVAGGISSDWILFTGKSCDRLILDVVSTLNAISSVSEKVPGAEASGLSRGGTQLGKSVGHCNGFAWLVPDDQRIITLTACKGASRRVVSI